MDEQNQIDSTPSETAGQSRILDQTLYELTSQWPIEPELVYGKRVQLLRLLIEVGAKRFGQAIQRTLDTFDGKFCPSISVIRANVRNDQRNWERNPDCPKCHGNGWVYVASHRVTRCNEPGCMRQKGA
jgi:hypothetical protein